MFGRRSKLIDAILAPKHINQHYVDAHGNVRPLPEGWTRDVVGNVRTASGDIVEEPTRLFTASEKVDQVHIALSLRDAKAAIAEMKAEAEGDIKRWSNEALYRIDKAGRDTETGARHRVNDRNLRHTLAMQLIAHRPDLSGSSIIATAKEIAAYIEGEPPAAPGPTEQPGPAPGTPQEPTPPSAAP